MVEVCAGKKMNFILAERQDIKAIVAAQHRQKGFDMELIGNDN
jgi:hypothetical protein